jgi:hypothetical protein
MDKGSTREPSSVHALHECHVDLHADESKLGHASEGKESPTALIPDVPEARQITIAWCNVGASVPIFNPSPPLFEQVRGYVPRWTAGQKMFACADDSRRQVSFCAFTA